MAPLHTNLPPPLNHPPTQGSQGRLTYPLNTLSQRTLGGKSACRTLWRNILWLVHISGSPRQTGLRGNPMPVRVTKLLLAWEAEAGQCSGGAVNNVQVLFSPHPRTDVFLKERSPRCIHSPLVLPSRYALDQRISRKIKRIKVKHIRTTGEGTIRERSCTLVNVSEYHSCHRGKKCEVKTAPAHYHKTLN